MITCPLTPRPDAFWVIDTILVYTLRMEIEVNRTRARLAAMSDSSAFEALAAGVLRQAEPSYRLLVETGR